MQCWQRVAPGTAGLLQLEHWASTHCSSAQPPVTSRYSSVRGGGVFSDWDCSARCGSVIGGLLYGPGELVGMLLLYSALFRRGGCHVKMLVP